MTTLALMTLLASSAEGSTLECNYQVENCWHENNVYTCHGDFQLDEDEHTVQSVTGNHTTRKTNSDVRILYINEQNLAFVPSGVSRFYPNLEGFELNNNTIQILTRDGFKGLTKLNKIAFRSNLITAIDSFIFIENPNIQWIDFSQNPLKHIGAFAFSNLKSPRTLCLMSANCVD